MFRGFIATLLVGVALACISCSGGGGSVPLIPEVASDSPRRPVAVQNGHAFMGAYTLSLGEDGEYTVAETRDAAAHFNVTAFVLPPGCPDCFWVNLTGIYGDIWEFDIHLKNPTAITGFDVRGIIFESGPVDFINPDSFTKCLAPDIDMEPINPFLVINSGVENNKWGPGAQGSAHAIFKKPAGVGWGQVDFLIDASWPANQKDPVRIRNLKAQPFDIYDDGSDFTTLSCLVDDWQGDVSAVTIDLTPIGGDTDAAFSFDGAKWTLHDVSFKPGSGFGAGIYDLLVTAESGGGEIHNYLRLTVNEAGISIEPSEWTLLVYMHASNLPDDEDINEMEMAGSVTGELNIIVLWDKPEGEGDDCIVRVLHDPNPYDGSDLTLVSQVVNDYGAVIPPSKQLEMGETDTLRNFLLWAMKKYHAHHYMLDLWDHGSGIFGYSQQRALFREVCNGLNLWEIRDAMTDALAAQTLVDKFDIIGFDVCLLGEIETGYALKDFTDYVVASETTEPGPGWDYAPPFVSLKENIHTQTAEEFAYNIVAAWEDSYDETPAPYHYSADTTQAASSTQKLVDVLVPQVNLLADELISIIADQKDLIRQCRDNSLNFWDPTFPDLGDFCLQLINQTDLPQSLRDRAQAVRDALEETMVLHVHTGEPYVNETGFRIWLPDNIDTDYYEEEYMNPAYLNFQETNWDEFLYAYGNPQHPVNLIVEDAQVDDSAGGNGDGYLQANETADISVKLGNTGYKPAIQLNCWLQVNDQYVQLISDFSPCDNIPPGESRWVTDKYSVSILGTCPEEHTFPFNMHITDEADKIYTPEFKLHTSKPKILIIDYDQNQNSATVIASTLDELGKGYDYVDATMPIPGLMDYEVLFISLGTFDGFNPTHFLLPEEGAVLMSFLNAGRSIYLEGGDCWYWDILWGAYDIATPFGISGLDDGWEMDFSTIDGAGGTPFHPFSFSYTGDNSFPDHLAPLGGGAYTAMTNLSPLFDCMIAYDSGTYRTIGASMEFGGLQEATSPNTHAEFLQTILDFFEG